MLSQQEGACFFFVTSEVYALSYKLCEGSIPVPPDPSVGSGICGLGLRSACAEGTVNIQLNGFRWNFIVFSGENRKLWAAVLELIKHQQLAWCLTHC